MKYSLYALRVFSFRWKESLEFYRDIIGFPVFFSDESIGWAQFDLGTAYLGLERCDPQDPEARELVGRFVGTSILVDDCQATCEMLEASDLG